MVRSRCHALCLGAVVAALPLGSLHADEGTSTIKIMVTNAEDASGHVRVSVFSGSEGFPGKRKYALKTASTTVQGSKAFVTVKDLPPGEYAVAVLHDQNDNGRMDTNAVGIPKEGWGVSLNKAPLIRAPRYSEAKFRLEPGQERSLVIKLRY